MLRPAVFCMLFFVVSCHRSTGPVEVAGAPKTPAAAAAPWNLDPANLPTGSQTLGTVQLSRYFPLYEAFSHHHGTGAAMSAWKIPVNDRFWWAVDTRYTFATGDDAARFLASQQAVLSEGHPLVETRLAITSDPAAKLFAGRIVHPGLGTPFFAFVVVGRHRHHVFKFLAAVEVPPAAPTHGVPATDFVPASEVPSSPSSEEVLRTDFLSLAQRFLKR